jgi:dienelactone hydrolase
VSLTVPAATLAGELSIPYAAAGLVVFAHGSGSSRHSPRNRRVADRLNQSDLATLLIDLLSEREERADLRARQLRFDIPLLAARVVAAIDWLQGEPPARDLRIGCFGASTGAAAALIAAARRPAHVAAVVSRGGRPDLAEATLAEVTSPTLLIVGGDDPAVLELNRRAQRRLAGEARLEVIDGATHLFEEPGALDRVADLACAWFLQHLRRPAAR